MGIVRVMRCECWPCCCLGVGNNYKMCERSLLQLAFLYCCISCYEDYLTIDMLIVVLSPQLVLVTLSSRGYNYGTVWCHCNGNSYSEPAAVDAAGCCGASKQWWWWWWWSCDMVSMWSCSTFVTYLRPWRLYIECVECGVFEQVQSVFWLADDAR